MLVPVLLTALFQMSMAHADRTTQCIGPEDAEKYYVFLHGSTGAVQGRIRALEKMAKDKNVRFAVATTDWDCKNQSGDKCWLKDDRYAAELKNSVDRVESAANDCFRNKKYGAIGFSNGANVVIDIIRFCQPNSFTSLIAVGGGTHLYPTDRQGLASCTPKLLMLSGTKDPAYPLAQKTAAELKAQNADVTFKDFEGGHVFQPTDIEPEL